MTLLSRTNMGLEMTSHPFFGMNILHLMKCSSKNYLILRPHYIVKHFLGQLVYSTEGSVSRSNSESEPDH